MVGIQHEDRRYKPAHWVTPDRAWDPFIEILKRLRDAHIEAQRRTQMHDADGAFGTTMGIAFDPVDVEHADWAFDHLASTGVIPERSDTRPTIAANVDR